MKKIITLIVLLTFSTLMSAQINSSGKEKKANVKSENKVHYIDRRTEKNQDAKKLPRVVNQKKPDIKKSPAVK